MKLPGNKNYEWHRIFRNFEHDEKGNLKRIFGTITNIEDEKHHEKELKEKIEIDPVLHVYNRKCSVERINEYINPIPKAEITHCLLLILMILKILMKISVYYTVIPLLPWLRKC